MTARWLAIVLALGLSAPSDAADLPTGRLPSDVRPVAYRIDLREDPAQPRFSGHVEIDVRLNRATRSIWINGRDLAVSRVEVRAGGRTIPAIYKQLAAAGVARLDLAGLAPAGSATLVIDYAGSISDSPTGLYRVQAGGRWYSYTQFQPIDARAAFPSFDEPGFKTPFTISLTLPRGLVAVSNAPETGATKAPDGWTTHRFTPTRPLPTYLVAFMAGPFATAPATVAADAIRKQPLPIRVVATAPQTDKLAFAARETGPIVTLLEEYFGDAFPFPKLDQIATPAWQSETAMENAGADTYADRVLLLGRDASVEQQRSFGMVVAHELSHQWFGDLVTPAWWDDLWLNESFANWMGYRIGNAWRPDLKIGSGGVVEALRAMDLDALSVGRPIRQPIASAEDSEGAFDEVTYGKGGQVVTQTAAYLGDVKFRDGVRLHLSRHRYGNATGDQFFTALSDAAHDPRIAASMRSFVDQQGVPLLTFSRVANGWKVDQSRYALLGGTAPRQTWVMPICVRPLAGERRCVLADQATTTLPMTGAGTIVPNAGGTGYYRFELPASDWQALIARMGELPAAEALAVNDSLWASFAAGRASPKQLVEAARRLAANPDSTAALDGATRLAGWRRHGIVEAADLNGYQRTVSSIYADRLASLGMELRVGGYASDDPDRRALREGLVATMALEAHDSAVRARLASAATRYLAGERAAVDEGFLPAALTVYLEEHDLATARQLLARGEASDDTVFRAAVARAVGAGAQLRSAADVQALVFDTLLAARSRARLAGSLVDRADVRSLALPVILSQLKTFGSYIPVSSPPGYTASLDQACSAEDARTITTALQPYLSDVRGGALAVDRMKERIFACGLLSTHRRTEVAAALQVS